MRINQGPPSDDAEPHDHLGPYRILGVLGRGGMGEVLLAHDTRLDRQVAIKRVRSDLVSPQTHARFQGEARLAAAFSHPAIVQVFDLFEQDGVQHLVMEHVAGHSLRQKLELEGPAGDDGLQIAHHLALGVAYAHARGVVHRDLKTENVLLSREGVAKITDFGIALRLSESGDPGVPGDAVPASERAIVGTYRAMSPEQICGDPLDARTDLFSFGVLLYELFTGRSPFEARTQQETIRRVIAHQPPPMHTLVPALPPALAGLVAELLAKEPDLRPATMEQVALRLEQITKGGDHLETRRSGLTSEGSQSDAPAVWIRRDDRRLPGLTILAHPAIERVGMRAELRELLAGEQVSISRLYPLFGPAGDAGAQPAVRRPLLESHLSRRPILLRCLPESGALLVDRAGSRTRVSVEGANVESRAELDAGALERGVVLVLSHRIVLWLHLFDPLVPPCSLDLLADAEPWRPDDVARLLFHFLRQEQADLGPGSLLSGSDGLPWPPVELVAELVRAPWPGRGPQLRDVARRLAVHGPGVSGAELQDLLRDDTLRAR